MKVLVTGGTGFIGAHTVAALRAEGHDVRLLVRSRDRVAPALDPLGVTDVDAVVGDCTDAASVRRATEGCDSVVHCANVFDWQPRAQSELVGVNTTTTEIVLGQAVEQGLDPIVHVSSYVALAGGELLTPDSPVREVIDDYAGSKAAAEVVARRYQDDGAPVVITYPGMVIGPHDPYFGESSTFLLRLLQRVAPVMGAAPCVDVRDVAAVQARAVVAGSGPRRFLVTGHDVTVRELASRAAAAAGVRNRPVAMPRVLATPMGRLMDALGRHTRIPVPGSSGAIRMMLEYTGGDAGTTTRELAVNFRPLDESLADTVAWMRATGRLRRRPVTADKPGQRAAVSPRA